MVPSRFPQDGGGTRAAIGPVLDAFGAGSGDAFFLLDDVGRVDWLSTHCRALFAFLSRGAASEGAQASSDEEDDSMAAIGQFPPSEVQIALESAALDESEVGSRVSDSAAGIAIIRINNRPFRLFAKALLDGRMACVLRDAYEQEELSRTKHEIVANISHDLRTPLTSISLLVDRMLGEEGESPALYRAAAGRILQQLQVLESLADDLVALNRLDSGRALLRLQPEDLSEIIDRSIEAIRPQSESRAVSIVSEIRRGTSVLVDRSQLERVLRNLLDNALHASRDGAQVRVTCQVGEDAQENLVSIWDEGEGVPDEDLERIFLRFFRGDRSRTHQGTGLGLAIARHIVEGHGGKIWAHNRKPPEHGAIVSFTLLRA